MFLKNRNIISKIKRSKVTDYAALVTGTYSYGGLSPFQDCMYLHELGEEAASFTKEEMQVG